MKNLSLYFENLLISLRDLRAENVLLQAYFISIIVSSNMKLKLKLSMPGSFLFYYKIQIDIEKYFLCRLFSAPEVK